MKRNVGRLGEGFFQQLCDNTAGLACNRSLVDERGWDFMVEFPMEPSHVLPLDMQPPPFSAFVQVKSTETRSLSCRVKLSNALRFTLRPEPCFLVFLVYDPAGREPKKAYLRHFWSPLIEQTVEAVRKAQDQGRTDLHTIRIPVTFDKSHEIAFDDLVGQIKEHTTSIKGGYAREKGKLAHFSGLDDGLGPFGLEFHEGVTDDDLVDLALGLRSSVPLKRMAPHSRRFGVTLPLHSFEFGPGELSLEVKPAAVATLVLSVPDADDIALAVEVFTPSAIPWIPSDKIRYRIKNAFIDFIFSPKTKETGSISIDLTADRALPMQDLEGFLKLVTSWRGRKVGTQVWVQDRMLMWGTIQIPAASDEEKINGWSAHLRFLQHFIREAPRSGSNVELCLQQLLDTSESILDFLSCTYNPSFKADGVNEALPAEDTQYRILYPVVAQMGPFLFCCLVSRMGYARGQNRRITLSMTEPSHLASYILRIDDVEDVHAQLLSDLEHRAESFTDEVPLIILADPTFRRAPD